MKIKKIFIPVFICLCLIAYVIGYASTTTTTNLSLVKPASEDTTVNFFDTVNSNMDLIDDIFDDVSLTEFSYLDGVTSSIQTQLDAFGAGDVDVSGTPVQYDIPRFTDANTIEGLSYAELKAALDLEIGTDVEAHDDGLLSIAGLTTAANKSIYTTALDTYAVYDLSAFARTILDDADASAVRTTIDALQDVANAIDSDHYTDASIDHEHLAPDVISGMTDVTSVDADYMFIWDETDGALKKVDMGEVRGGYTNLTSFVDQTAWRVFYSNTAGDITELALGVDGTFLGSNGATSAPTFSTPTGAGDMLKAVYDTDQDSDIDVSSGGTEKSSWTQYCIPYLSGATAFGEIPIGTDNYALTVNGSTGYDWTHLQVYDAGLLSLAGLTYVSPSFIKVIATDTYAIRTIAETITDLALDSDDLSDVASIAMLNEAETITGNWVNTTNPWADNEVANDITINLATLATTFTCTDNENEALNCPIVFVDSATGAQGGETDGDLHYNPSTGTLTATTFAGALTGNATTCTTASAGDAAVDFFGAGVDAVTDATTCTDIEGLGLTIDTGVLKVDYADVSDEIAGDIAEGELADSIIVSADIKDGVIAEADLKVVDSPADEDVFTYESTTGDFEWHTKDQLGIKFSKYDATSAPTVNNDVDEGYVVGSRWIDVTNDDAYTCLDNTDGAAVWSTVGGVSFLDLTDTPAAYESGKYAKSTAAGLIWDTALGVDTYGTPVDNEFAKFTDLNTIEGRSYAEVKTDLNLIQCENNAAAAPTVNDDVDLGYAVNSIWSDTTNDKSYICVDTTDGAAVWLEIDIEGLNSDDLSDVASIAMLDEAESITGNWVNTTSPWADNEVANNITIDLATLATTITVTDNEATAENNPICFVAGADPDGGSLGIETDGDLHYNPSTGTLTVTAVASALTGNVTGDVSGSSGTCTGEAATVATIDGLAPNTATTQATQASITTCANLTSIGTIATGVWEGTDVGLGHGGTGVSTGAMVNFTSILNTALYVGRDADNQIKFATDNNIIFRTSGADGALFGSTGELDMNAHSIGFTQQSTTGDGTTTIDWKLGNKFKFTFGAQNDTFTFTAPTNPCNILLMLIQDGTGSRLATWPGTVKWAGGTAPTLTTGAGTIDICSFYWDGTNYFGVASLAFAVP